MVQSVDPWSCTAQLWVTGVIVPDRRGSAAIRDDQGVVRSITWGLDNTAVVYWGRRYRMGGLQFTGPDTFWACDPDAVILQ
jgi:hypothetical protein